MKFTRGQANYLLTQPLHHSQHKIDESKEHVTIGLNVHPSPELEIKILGWGKDVEVLEPKELSDTIRKEVKELNKIYK